MALYKFRIIIIVIILPTPFLISASVCFTVVFCAISQTSLKVKLHVITVTPLQLNFANHCGFNIFCIN